MSFSSAGHLKIVSFIMKFSMILFSAWFAVLSPAIAMPIPSFDDDLLFTRSHDGLYRFDDEIELLEARAVGRTRVRGRGPQPVREAPPIRTTPRLHLIVPQGQSSQGQAPGPQHQAVGTGHSTPSLPTAPPNTPVASHNVIAPDFSGILASHFANLSLNF